MSLTDGDIEQIRKMIDDSNDALYERFKTNALGEVNTRLESIEAQLEPLASISEDLTRVVARMGELDVMNDNIQYLRDLTDA